MRNALIDLDPSTIQTTGRIRTTLSPALLRQHPSLRQAVERTIAHPLGDRPFDALLDPETAAALRDRVQAHLSEGSLAPSSIPFHCFEAIRELVRSGQLVLTVEIAPIRSGSNAILRALLHHPEVAAVAKNLSRRFAAGADQFWGCLLATYAAHRHGPTPVRIVYKDHWIAVPRLLESQILEVAGEILFVVRDPVQVAFSIAQAFTASDELLASILRPRLSARTDTTTDVGEFLAAYARRAGFADWHALQRDAADRRDYRSLDALFRRLELDSDAPDAMPDDQTGEAFAQRHPAAFLASWAPLARLAGQIPAGARATVVDMTALQVTPAQTLRHLCRRLGLPEAATMHRDWQKPLPGPALRDAVLTRDVDASTGITPPLRPTPPLDHLPASLRGFVERALVVYLEMLCRARADSGGGELLLEAADQDVVRCNPLSLYAHAATAPQPDGDRRRLLSELRRERPDLSPLFDAIDAWVAAQNGTAHP